MVFVYFLPTQQCSTVVFALVQLNVSNVCSCKSQIARCTREQGEALQDVGRIFGQTVGRDGAESTAASPLLVQAMEHCKVASLGSLHFL